MNSAQILNALPSVLRSAFVASGSGASVVLRYNDTYAASNTRAQQLRDAELALQGAGFAAMELDWDIYVSEAKPVVEAAPWPPVDDEEEEEAPDTDRYEDDAETDVDDAPLFVSGLRSPRGYEDAVRGAW